MSSCSTAGLGLFMAAQKAYSTARVERKTVCLILSDGFVSSAVQPTGIANDTRVCNHMIMPIHFKVDSNHLTKWIEVKIGLVQCAFSANVCNAH